MMSKCNLDSLAKTLDENRGWKPPNTPPIKCRVCGKIPSVMYQNAAYHPYYIQDNCIGIFAGASYGGATYQWNKENEHI